MTKPRGVVSATCTGATLDLIVSVDDHRRNCPSDRRAPLFAAARDALPRLRLTWPRANAPGRKRGIRFERDAHFTQPVAWIDHGTEQAHPALEGRRDTAQRHLRRLADLDACKILLGERPRISISQPRARRNSGSPPGAAVWPNSAVRVSTRPAAGARITVRSRRACISASCAAATLTRACVGDRSRATSLYLFAGQRASGLDTLGAPVFRLATSAACASASSSEAAGASPAAPGPTDRALP